MNQDPAENRLREVAWRRELTDVEKAQLRAWLEANPQAEADWESEAELNTLLGKLADAPVSSNFTARVMQAVEREAQTRARETSRRVAWGWRVFLPRIAVAVAVVCVGLFTYHRQEVKQRRELVQSIRAVPQVESLPNPAFLTDFDAINRLGPAPDEELLALMQ